MAVRLKYHLNRKLNLIAKEHYRTMNKKVTQMISLIAVFGGVTIGLTSCQKHDPNSPGTEFMPDMYRSPSLETNMAYVDMNTGDTLQANRLPAKGSIARGYMPYEYGNDTSGYSNAGKYLHNPLAKTAINLTEGEVLYGKYCVHCHGANGDGDGKVADKLPGPPPPYSGKLKDLPEGKIFHSITYGKGLMGSHSGQLTKEERWKVVLFVQKLQNPEGVVVANNEVKQDSTVAVK